MRLTTTAITATIKASAKIMEGIISQLIFFISKMLVFSSGVSSSSSSASSLASKDLKSNFKTESLASASL